MRIFIASSGERLNTAIEVGSWLESMNVEPVLWNEPEVFPLSVYTWDALIDLSENVDAAVFIFGEDDKIWFRGEGTMTVRDNVLLEYGLFSGKLQGIVTGAICGTLLDLFVGKSIGITGIMLGIVGFLGGYFDKNFSKDSKITIIFMVLGATIIYELGKYMFTIVSFKLEVELLPFIKILFVELIYQILLTIFDWKKRVEIL